MKFEHELTPLEQFYVDSYTVATTDIKRLAKSALSINLHIFILSVALYLLFSILFLTASVLLYNYWDTVVDVVEYVGKFMYSTWRNLVLWK